MVASLLARAARVARLGTSRRAGRASSAQRNTCRLEQQRTPALHPGYTLMQRSFLSSTAQRQLIVPDGQPKKSVETPKVTQTPAVITEEEYHRVADSYLDQLLTHLEKLQDKREDVDVEYANGVLTVTFGHDGTTYVINKQPPNKQIWLSSPKSGPKRYDYVISGDGQGDKQDTASGEWIYLRDGTTMSQLFGDEMGIDLRMPVGNYDS